MAAPLGLVFGWLLLLPFLSHGFPGATLILERATPHSSLADMPRVVAYWDRIRHEKIFHSPPSSSSSRVPIELPVNGSFTQTFYYTRIRLGSPPREYKLLIDTGSDVAWISCVSCQGCPKSHSSSGFFDPRASSTASIIRCNDRRCPSEMSSRESYCSHNDCSFSIEYGDHSNSSGYYVSDLLHLHSDSVPTNFTSEILFGCSTESQDITILYESMNGILGLGPSAIALTSQLASQGVAPGAFCHCLRGDGVGGGQLLLGAALVPGMNYTPIVSRLHYSVIMRSITVNDRRLTINPSVFAKSETIVDSGTTMAYIIDGAYDPLVQAVTAAVSQVARPYIAPDQEQYCYSTSSSLDVFPRIRMDFEGGAFLWLNPQDYVQQRNPTLWCLGFLRTTIPGVTILGELVLRDKIVVYDLEAQRIGWVKYNCSTPFKVSTDSANTGNDNSTNSCMLNILWCVIVFVTMGLGIIV